MNFIKKNKQIIIISIIIVILITFLLGVLFYKIKNKKANADIFFGFLGTTSKSIYMSDCTKTDNSLRYTFEIQEKKNNSIEIELDLNNNLDGNFILYRSDNELSDDFSILKSVTLENSVGKITPTATETVKYKVILFLNTDIDTINESEEIFTLTIK